MPADERDQRHFNLARAEYEAIVGGSRTESLAGGQQITCLHATIAYLNYFWVEPIQPRCVYTFGPNNQTKSEPISEFKLLQNIFTIPP